MKGAGCKFVLNEVFSNLVPIAALLWLILVGKSGESQLKANRIAFLAAQRWVVQLTQQGSHHSKKIDTTTCNQEITLLVLILSWIICNVGNGVTFL